MLVSVEFMCAISRLAVNFIDIEVMITRHCAVVVVKLLMNNIVLTVLCCVSSGLQLG